MGSVDKFGRHSGVNHHIQAHRSPKGHGFSMTKEGDYDMQNKRVCNLKDAESSTDAVSLQVLKNSLDGCVTNDGLNKKIAEVGDGLKIHFNAIDDQLKNHVNTLQKLSNQLVVETDVVRFAGDKKRIVGVGASLNKNDVVIREELHKVKNKFNKECDDNKLNMISLKRDVDQLNTIFIAFREEVNRYTAHLNPRLTEMTQEIDQLKQIKSQLDAVLNPRRE